MKTNFLLCCALTAAIGGLAAVGTGCRENKANAQVTVVPGAAPTSAQPVLVEKAVNTVPAIPASAVPPPAAEAVVATTASPAGPPPAPIIITNPNPPGVAIPTSNTAPQVVQEAAVPEAAAVSPALADLVKMMHAGVTEDVLVSYVTNSAEPFYIGADQVVYLKDIGASPALITTLLNHENQPQIAARRQASAAVKPLPEGVAVNAPVTGVYPGQTAPAPSTEPTPVNSAYSASASAPPPPAGGEPTPVVTNPEPVEVSTFYTTLAPYGTWVDIPDYGYCWRPTVSVYNAGWSPYSNDGRWLWSDAGWYWYSDYSWGWAPFHYGRWCTYPGYGWVWSPGTVWGPAWVTWRYTDAYCGWAPLPPACGWSAGVGLTWYGSGVSVGFGFGLASSCYTFVGWNSFCAPNPYRYCAQPTVVNNIFNNTVVVNNYSAANKHAVINKGVGTERIAGPVPKATIREASYSGGKMPAGTTRRETLQKDGTLSVYRPEYVGAQGITTRRTTTPAGSSAGKSAITSATRPPGTERFAPSTRSGSASSGIAPAATTSGNVSSRPTAAPTSRFQATPSAPSTRTSPTVYPGTRSTTPSTPTAPRNTTLRSTTPAPSAGATVRSTTPTPSAPRSVTTPSAPVSRPSMPSTAPSSAPRSSAPAIRSTPAYSAPAVRSTPSYSAPAVRSAPSYSAPAIRSAPSAPSHSAPAIRSAPSTPSYSAPAIRSAPSYSAPTRSSPSGGRSGRD